MDDKKDEGRNSNIKYRIISEKIMRDLVEFLDEIQFEAAKGKTPEDIHIINLCNHLISQLINSREGFDIIDDDIDDHIIEFPEGLSDEDYNKLISEFDEFVKSWGKHYEKPKKKKGKKDKKELKFKPHIDDVSEYMSLEEIKEYLIDDPELTDYERFELYYDERERRKKSKEKSYTMDEMLKECGINPYKAPPKDSKN